MAQTYQQLADLSVDIQFRGRVKIACLSYAEYIANEAPSATAHNTRYKWAQQTFTQPDFVAQQIQSAVVMQDPVKTEGAAVSDSELQTAVELTVNAIM